MLYIVPFCQRNDLYQYDWLNIGASVKFVVPHPKLADGVRETGERYRPDLNIESTTIADFIKNEVSYSNSSIKIYKKYQLILELSTVWKKYVPLGSYEEFMGVFDGFTQLRGITIDFDLVEQILDSAYLGFTEGEVESIKKFWKYLEIRKIYDEHAACSYLAERYEKETAENIIFYGFSHLSSGQCDLLNVMGESQDVRIPVHVNVWKEARESDWIKWINAKVLPVPSHERRPNKVSLVKISNNGLGQAVKRLAKEHCKDRAVEIVLAQKNPDFFQVGELAWDEIFFKVEVSVLGNTYTKIFNAMDKFFDWKENVDTGSVLSFFQGIVDEELNKNFEEKDFKIIRVASFIHDEIKEWMELSEENAFMRIFDYYVFRNSLELNLPRNYIFPQADKDMKVRVRGIEDIEAVGADNLVVVCATSKYSDVDSREDIWTEKMIESFLKIGPVKRKEFEFRMLKESITDILAECSSFLMFEESLIEESYLWREILSEFNIEKIVFGESEKKEKIDYIKNLEKKPYSPSDSKQWSSGKIQKYLDCPRAFYYNYIDRIYFSPENQQEVEARDFGSLQHKTIRLYLEQFHSLDEEAHHDLLKDVWNQFLQEKNLVLNDLSYRNGFIEIKNYSWRGIKSLLDIKNVYPKARFSFEVEFFSQTHRGSIDCIINLGDGMMGIVDFKRSNASIPGKAEVFDFKKIQLWYYMYNLKREGFKSCFLGYLCLAELEKSQFVFDGDVLSGSDFGKIFPMGRSYSCSFKEKGDQFEQFLQEKIEHILEDKSFLPLPESGKVCNFCWMDKICIREVRE